jgi:hypothetical protein
MNAADQLEPDEDAELRRLHSLRGFGMVAGTVTSRYETLRVRDRRKSVRDPDEQSVAVPIEKKLWADPVGKMEPVAAVAVPGPQRPAVPVAASGAQRVVGDSREVFGERPEPRRGLGLFRRRSRVDPLGVTAVLHEPVRPVVLPAAHLG